MLILVILLLGGYVLYLLLRPPIISTKIDSKSLKQKQLPYAPYTPEVKLYD